MMKKLTEPFCFTQKLKDQYFVHPATYLVVLHYLPQLAFQIGKKEKKKLSVMKIQKKSQIVYN
jgi:hypothetical protein